MGTANPTVTTIINTPVPVELVSFTANVNRDKVELLWETATEVNNYGFDVERLASSHTDWEKIGFVPGAGNSNSPKSYTFTDKKLSRGNYSYRLKQIDSDGKFSYSNEIEVLVNEVPTAYTLMQNYPNPFNPSTKISWQSPESSWQTLKVYDALGREIEIIVDEYLEAGTHSTLYNVHSSLPSGVYFYRLQAGSFVQTRKMILLK